MREKVEIEKVYTRKKNGVVPTLIKFQNGKLSAFTKENTHFCRLKNGEDENQMGALLVANGHTYHGTINDTTTSDMTDTYICVRNKRTNKMTVVPIDQVTLKNSIYQVIDKTKREGLSEHLSKMHLLKKYSSRKASRYISDKEKMQMDINIVQEELEATVNEADIKPNQTVENINNTAYFDTIRPKVNKEAKNVNEVYKIEDVVPADLLNRLEEEAKTIYQTPISMIPIKSGYLKKRIETIQASPIDNERLLHLKLIIYMDCLQRLIISRARNLKKAELSEISEKVENNVRDRFADPNASFIGSRTTFSTEKALCHFIVLSLLINVNYQIDASILAEELNTNPSKIYKYAHIVQALRKSKTSIISLNLPKNVPPIQAQSKKKRK